MKHLGRTGIYLTIAAFTWILVATPAASDEEDDKYIAKLEQRVRDLDDKIKQMLAELRRMADERDGLAAKVQALEAERMRAAEKEKQHQKTVDGLHEQLRQAKQLGFEESGRVATDLQKVIHGLRDQLAVRYKRIAELENERADAKVSTQQRVAEARTAGRLETANAIAGVIGGTAEHDGHERHALYISLEPLRALMRSENFSAGWFAAAVAVEWDVDDPATLKAIIDTIDNWDPAEENLTAWLVARADRVAPIFVGALRSDDPTDGQIAYAPGILAKTSPAVKEAVLAQLDAEIKADDQGKDWPDVVRSIQERIRSGK